MPGRARIEEACARTHTGAVQQPCRRRAVGILPKEIAETIAIKVVTDGNRCKVAVAPGYRLIGEDELFDIAQGVGAIGADDLDTISRKSGQRIA